MKNRVLLGMFVLLIAMLFFVGTAAAKDKIVIGQAISLSGPQAPAVQMAGGPIYELWVEEVNKQGGIYVKEYGNVEYTCKRTVKVIDNTSPIVTLNLGIDTLVVGNGWVDAGVLATDDFDDDLRVEVYGSVDYYTIGQYEITYIVTDNFLNYTTVIRIVNITE